MILSKQLVQIAVTAGIVAGIAAPALARTPIFRQPGAFAGKGFIHRLASETARDAERAAEFAQSIVDSSPRFRRPAELRAVHVLLNVKRSALEFRNALDAEPIYFPRPTFSIRAFEHLEREYFEMSRNPVLWEERGSFAGLNAEVRRIQTTVLELRRFYTTAERAGYRMAEVSLLSEHLSVRTEQVLRLAEAERDWSWREARIVNQLRELHAEVRAFAERARFIVAEIERTHGYRQVDVRVELSGLYNVINRRTEQLTREIETNRRHSFPLNVKNSFANAEETLEELDYAFSGVR